jgi:serine/threonine protein kinase
MELIDGCTLEEYLGKFNSALPERMAIWIFVQILRAVEYCHENDVLHRDIKPANILLTKKLQVKLADFGISKQMEEMGLAATYIGTPITMAPEVIKHENYSFSADIWSLGCILYEMINGSKPFGKDPKTFFQNVLNCNPFAITSSVSKVTKDLVFLY